MNQRLTHFLAAVISSITAFFTHSASAEIPASKVKLSKKTDRTQDDSFPTLDAATAFQFLGRHDPPKHAERYPWKQQSSATIVLDRRTTNGQQSGAKPCQFVGQKLDQIVTAVSIIPTARAALISFQRSFTPRQNPFYCALPYNDKASTGHRPEAPQVVPWFKEAYQGPAVSTCKGRWIAIRKGNRVAYAQWEDAGPFRTDHWQYVFGNERPKPNLNKGAGLDVSPAVRDFLRFDETDVTDWRFVEFSEVPHGPWAQYGDNNTFVLNARGKQTLQAQERTGSTR